MKTVTALGQIREQIWAWQWTKNREVVAQLLTLLLGLSFALSPQAANHPLFALAYIPPLWIAFRHGLWGAVIATTMLDLCVALNVVWLSNAPAQTGELLISLAFFSIATLRLGFNVSQNQNKQNALHLQLNRLNVILDALPVLVAYIDTDERYQYNNLAYQTWFNLPLEKITGSLMRTITSEKSYQTTKEQIDKVLAGQPILSQQLHYTEPQERWGDITYIPDISPDISGEGGLKGDSKGKVRGFVTFVKDVTNEKIIEDRLTDVLELNQKILEATTMGILVYTPKGDCVLFNEAAAKIAGAPNVQAISQNFHQISSWRDYGLLDTVLSVLETGVPHRQEFHVISTFGKDVWLDFQAALLTANGKKHILVVFDDITERKFAELVLARHSGKLEELVQERTSDLQATNLQLQQAMREREQAEHALRESEEHFRLLAENVRDTIFRYDLIPEPRLTYVGPATTRITGYTPEEYYADPLLFSGLISPEDLERMSEIFQDPNQHPDPLEIRMRRKDGTYIWTEQRHVPIYDDEGNCVTVVGISRDITQRRRVDEQLRKLSRAVEQCSVSITVLDANGNIEYVNPRFTQVTGFTFEDVQGHKPRILLPENAALPEAQQLWHTFHTGSEWRGELHNTTKTGSEYWESGVISPIYDKHEKITHFLAVMEDVTQRKQQERERETILAVTQALRAANDSEEMLSLILQEITTNFAATKTFFIAPDPATGEMVVEAVYEDGEYKPSIGVRIPPGIGVAAHVYRTNQPYITDDAFNDSLNATPELLGDASAVTCVPLIAQGVTIGLFSVARKAPMNSSEVRLLVALADMAATGLQRAAYHEETLRHAANLERAVAEQTYELRQANLRLQELDQLKSKFVSNVSHELRTPVTNISLYVRLIKRKPEKREEYLDVLEEEAGRLESLVLDILDLAQLDNKPALVLCPININELLESVVAAHFARAESRHLELSLQTTENLPMIMGDPVKLMQVASNLVANAINYTPNGYVQIRTFARNDHTVGFLVKDSGTGIYPEDVPNLFQRFYRGRRDQIADVSGTGLGLSIVKELVELHGGSIDIESKVGGGSTFTITLPTEVHVEHYAD